MKKRIFKIIGRVLGVSLLVFIAVVAVLTARVKLPGDETIPAGYRRNQALYLKMRDGVEIAVDVWLPRDLQKNERVPVLMRSTRYWRAQQIHWGTRTMVVLGLMRPEDAFDRLNLYFNERHFAVILVDARGSGASGGVRLVEFAPEERADYGEIAAWATQQPWSNGRVGAYGVSYEGATAEFTAETNQSAVRAVAPLFSPFDPMGVVRPGGVYARTLLAGWSSVVASMDRNELCAAFEVTGWHCALARFQFGGVKPVDGDPDGVHLAELISQRHNYYPSQNLPRSEFRDDPLNASASTLQNADISAYHYRAQIEASGAAMQVWCGWLDGQFCDGALSRYLTFKNPQQVIIGPLSHGGGYNVDPFADKHDPPIPLESEQNRMVADFFDKVLRAEPAEKIDSSIQYYTMGEGQWHTTKTWPPAGLSVRRYYLAPNHALETAPTVTPGGNDTYRIDFTASAGEHTRWHTGNGGDDVVYPDRRDEDKKLLVYTSTPLESDLEITGSPTMNLQLASTASDGAIHAYLEDVSPDGRVTYLDEGILRIIQRKLADLKSFPYVPLGPSHSLLRNDAEPLAPGVPAEIQFSFFTTSVLLRKGHCLRLALAGADVGMFQQYPAKEAPTWTVFREKGRPSYFELPVKTR